MGNIKLVDQDYLADYAIYNLIHYIIKSPYLKSFGCVGLLYPFTARNIEEASIQMASAFQYVRSVYNKDEEKKRLVEHLVFGFAPSEFMTELEAVEIACAVAGFIGQKYQVVWGIHKGSYNEPNYIHIHLAFNRVSYMDGRRFYETNAEREEIKRYAESIRPDLKWSFLSIG